MTGKNPRHRIVKIIAGGVLLLFFLDTLAVVEYYG